MLDWLRARNPTVDHGKRIVRKADRGEPPSDIDQIEELVRIVGEAKPRPRAKPTTKRRAVSRLTRSARGPRREPKI